MIITQPGRVTLRTQTHLQPQLNFATSFLIPKFLQLRNTFKFPKFLIFTGPSPPPQSQSKPTQQVLVHVSLKPTKISTSPPHTQKKKQLKPKKPSRVFSAFSHKHPNREFSCELKKHPTKKRRINKQTKKEKKTCPGTTKREFSLT